MMRRKKLPSRISLLILFSLYIFFVLIATILIVFSVFHVLNITGLRIYERGLVPLTSFAVIFLIVSMTLAIMSNRIPLNPVNKLIDAIERLGQGDFSVRIDLGKESIMREVAESFNDMAEELNSIEILRNDFVNNFSHEFKTPIVSIQGFAKLLKKGDLSLSQQEEYLDIIIEETKRLSDLSAQILALSKIEKQTILSDTSRFDVSEQVRETIILLEKQWEAKELEIDFKGRDFFIKGNQELLKQVWINLFENAIKFSQAKSPLKVNLEKKRFYEENKVRDWVLVTITNYGPAIPENEINRIFDKFYQGDVSRQTKGNGLGLALVKKIVDLHQGRIEVESENMATSFRVRLPL